MFKRRVALIAVLVSAASGALPASATAWSAPSKQTSLGWIIFAAGLGIPLLLFISFAVVFAVRKGRTRRSDGVQSSADQYAPKIAAIQAYGGQAGTAPTVDVADELTKLAGLRDRGALTDAEFQAQKTKLLAQN
jgi:hypothetical protein